ncbi:hypothetical protein J8J17_21720, partial [Mycobacterium tuberculosis]|nr:hypothetical protein [Mycobacterium tuberculosis]
TVCNDSLVGTDAAWWVVHWARYCDRFVPSHYRIDTLVKLQRLQQGSMCVDEYYKLMESVRPEKFK